MPNPTKYTYNVPDSGGVLDVTYAVKPQRRLGTCTLKQLLDDTGDPGETEAQYETRLAHYWIHVGIEAKENCLAYERDTLADWVPQAIRKGLKEKEVSDELMKLPTLKERILYIESKAPKGLKDSYRIVCASCSMAQYSRMRRDLGLPMKKSTKVKSM